MAPACSWLSLLGVLGSLENMVPLGRLHIRPIHFCVRNYFLIGVHPLSHTVTIDQEAQTALLWWLSTQNLKAEFP